MATKSNFKGEQLLTVGVVFAAIIGMFFIASKTYLFIFNNYEEYINTFMKLLRSGLQ